MATNNVINQIGPLPAFMYTAAATQSNVTGGGTIYVVQFPAVIYDVTSSFNAGTGVFTAPLSGKYSFNVQLDMRTINASMTRGLLNAVTTTTTYRLIDTNPASVYGALSWQFNESWTCPLSAGDTIHVYIQILGSADIADVYCATQGVDGYVTPIFSGYMISGI